MSLQWLRKAQVIVGKGGSGLSVDQLKIVFEINKTIQPTPNTALIKIYNLNPNHENTIHNEYDEVILNAGYKDNVKVIFRGNIKHVFKYRDKVDYVTEIEAADGDRDFRNSIINRTLSAGTTRNNVLQAAVSSFQDTRMGFSNIGDERHIRGVVLSGSTRRVLDNLARDTGANWSIQDGLLTVVKTDSTLPNTAIVISSDTGLLEAPEVNDKGVGVKCLMNPDLLINGSIKLDNNNIRIRERRLSLLSHGNDKRTAKEKPPVRLDPDGIYKIIAIRHAGDNRGKAWTSELVCISLGSPIPDNTDNSTEELGGIF